MKPSRLGPSWPVVCPKCQGQLGQVVWLPPTDDPFVAVLGQGYAIEASVPAARLPGCTVLQCEHTRHGRKVFDRYVIHESDLPGMLTPDTVGRSILPDPV